MLREPPRGANHALTVSLEATVLDCPIRNAQLWLHHVKPDRTGSSNREIILL